MKMRKLFAGLAAAATLLSGMAIGVAAAQADDAPLLQVNHAQEGHTYTPYKFAMFENPGDGSVEVKTVDAWKGAVTTAADVADGSHNGIPTEYKDNPAAYVATFTADRLRVFAKTLAGITPPAGPDGIGLTVTTEQANTSRGQCERRRLVSGEGYVHQGWRNDCDVGDSGCGGHHRQWTVQSEDCGRYDDRSGQHHD